jgi:hypothetical protein
VPFVLVLLMFVAIGIFSWIQAPTGKPWILVCISVGLLYPTIAWVWLTVNVFRVGRGLSLAARDARFMRDHGVSAGNPIDVGLGVLPSDVPAPPAASVDD